MADTKTTPAPRPLSPHLGIYRWKLHMLLSILHRATGVALALSSPVLVLWLWSAAYSPACFEHCVHFFKSQLGILLLFGWSFAFYLHFCNGIRHLFWDIGKGFDIHTAAKTGWLVVIFALFFTASTWYTVEKYSAQKSSSEPQSLNSESSKGGNNE